MALHHPAEVALIGESSPRRNFSDRRVGWKQFAASCFDAQFADEIGDAVRLSLPESTR